MLSQFYVCLFVGRFLLAVVLLGICSTSADDRKWVWNDNRRSIDDGASSSNQQAFGQIKLKLDDQAESSYNKNKYTQKPQSDYGYYVLLVNLFVFNMYCL